MSRQGSAVVLTVCGLIAGCSAIPVQETTLVNENGGSVTCKQVGRGVVSYGVGKSIYEDCVAKAKAQGYH
jgi:hypothetical protein